MYGKVAVATHARFPISVPCYHGPSDQKVNPRAKIAIIFVFAVYVVPFVLSNWSDMVSVAWGPLRERARP